MTLLVEESKVAPTTVATVGMQSNLAAAVVRDPDASLRALNAGFRARYVPCDVTFRTALHRDGLERLRRRDDLCRALATLVEVWREVLWRNTGGRLAADKVAVLHDPLTVACLVDRRFVTTAVLPVTVACHRGTIRTFVDPVEGRDVEVVTGVDAVGFEEWWLSVVLGD